MSKWWSRLRSSYYKDVPFVLLGLVIGWNSDLLCSVKGVSMLPTISPGEYIAFVPYSFLRISQYFGFMNIKVGDIVLLKINEDLSVCKRVTRLTHDKNEAEEWNAEEFPDVPDLEGDSPPSSEPEYYEQLSRAKVRSIDWDTCIEKATEKSTYIWVEGDNSKNSHDSRMCGAVPLDCLRGTVKAVVWPKPRLLH